MATNQKNEPESLDDDPVGVGKGLDARRDIPVGRGRGQATQPVGAKGWLRTFTSLRIRNYRWFWLGNVFSSMAMNMQMIARSWLVYQITGSALALGWVNSARAVPILLFSLFGGVLADRMEKRNLIIVAQVGMGVISLTVAILILTGAIEVWHLIVASLAGGMVSSFNMPGRQAMIPELVGRDNLMNAIAVRTMGMNLSRMVIPAIAGMLIVAIGVGGVYSIGATCYVFAILCLLMIPVSGKTVSRPSGSIVSGITEGLRYVCRSSTLLTLLAVGFIVMLFGMSYRSFMAVFAVDVFQIGPEGYGTLTSAIGAGALIGSIVVASLGNFKRKGLLLVSMTIGFGVMLTLFALSPHFYLALCFLPLVGMFSTGRMTTNQTLLQANSDAELRGRVMSLYMMVFGLAPLATLPTGAIIDMIGGPTTIAVCGIIMALFGLGIAVLRPSLRRLE